MSTIVDSEVSSVNNSSSCDLISSNLSDITSSIDCIMNSNIDGSPALCSTNCSRQSTIIQMQKAGINYDQLIMGFGGGDRILINDRKPHDPNKDTAYCINLQRNKGIEDLDI